MKKIVGKIKAKVEKGKYKDNTYEIEIAPTGAETIVKCNGQPMKNVESAIIKIKANEVTTLNIKTWAII